jgi:hypothetical protein
MAEQEKGPLAMSKRPKSREETPKEGSDNAQALPHRNNMRPRRTKRKGFQGFFGENLAGMQSGNTRKFTIFCRGLVPLSGV